MTRVALRGILGRKLRTVLTAFAIVLGVAMVSGTFVLTDTIQKAFDSIFTSAYDNTDAVVTGRKLLEWSASGKALVSQQQLDTVRALPQVDSAAGTILDISGDTNNAKILDREGKAIDNGNPTFGLGVNPADERFNPFRLVEGTWASGPGQVVVDQGTADDQHFTVGQRIRVAGDGPAKSYRLTGIAKFGDVSSLGGATVALFDVKTAQAVLHKDGFDAISVAGEDGVSPERLVEAITPTLPDNEVVRTGEQQAKEDGKSGDFVKYIRYFLLAFGGVALFVGGFVIFNTLSITVAQRTRELATLRTLGASRRQVLRSVIVEGGLQGFIASLVGLAGGVGLAVGLVALMRALNLDLPRTGMVFALRTVIVSLLVGTLITLIASIVPAIKATRIPPISAVREGGLVTKKLSPKTFAASLIVTVLSLAAVSYALLGNGVGAAPRILGIVLGVLGLFIGIAMLAPRLVRPLAHLVGAPGAAIGGVAGRLARENATRNPSRTAATAAALMIGLALVTFVAVFGKGLLASDKHAVSDQIGTSYVVTSQNGWATFTAAAGRKLDTAEGVTLASSVRYDRARLVENDNEIDVSGVEPATIARAYNFTWEQGSDATVASLGPADAIVRHDLAKDDHVRVGDILTFETPNGTQVTVNVRGIFKPSDLDSLLGGIVLSQAAFDRHFPRPADAYTFADADSKQTLRRALAAFPDANPQTKGEYVNERVAWLTNVMNLFYVLLALSVIVSLFGMVNTLVLSVFERTRELGMLRAVGMTRRQTRRMIRHESVITALIGAALGLPLGIGLGALSIQALSKYGVSFSLPVGTVVVFAIVAVAAGILAAVAPARRASRLDVLGALQYE
jgi:putative ABC transport system permease protein